MNCWEFIKCGREKGGKHADELGVCPAWPDHGQQCSQVAGTFCGGQVQGTRAQKLKDCTKCDFFHLTQASQNAHKMILKLIELCPLGVIGVNREGILTIFNSAAEKLTGRRKEEVLFKEAIQNLYRRESDAKELKKKMLSSSYGGPDLLQGVEVTVKGAGGVPIPVKVWGFIIRENGEELGSVGFFFDLSEQKQAEELRLKQEKLSSVLEMAGAVLHHLSQPLQVLLNDSSLLLSEIPREDPLRESVEAIRESVNTLHELMTKIRKLDRLRTSEYAGGTKIIDL